VLRRCWVTVGDAVVDHQLGVPVPPIVSELLKLVPEDEREEAKAKAMDITLESRTMKFQPMKAAGLLLGHFEAQESQLTRRGQRLGQDHGRGPEAGAPPVHQVPADAAEHLRADQGTQRRTGCSPGVGGEAGSA